MIIDIIHARDEAIQTDGWVVVVVPSDGFEDALTALVAVANGYPFGGRTVVLPGNSRLSLVKAEDPVFLPEGTPFNVMFLGWGRVKVTKATVGIDRWLKAARTTFSRDG